LHLKARLSWQNFARFFATTFGGVLISLQQQLSHKIFFIRGHRVMMDSDLAVLYRVETKTLNRAVRRNIIRFPEDFMFQPTEKEEEILRCQIGTSSLYKSVEKNAGLGYI
jgi:hypothetical protein